MDDMNSNAGHILSERVSFIFAGVQWIYTFKQRLYKWRHEKYNLKCIHVEMESEVIIHMTYEITPCFNTISTAQHPPSNPMKTRTHTY